MTMMRSAVHAAAAVAAANTSLRQNGMVACNVYVSAASQRKHQDMLLQLLRKAQLRCQQLRSSDEALDPVQHPMDAETYSSQVNNPQKNIVAVVHAFGDVVYNRSSFHLAGTPSLVETVASELAIEAIHNLSQMKSLEQVSSDDGILPHPSVGWVDHVAVMPLRSNQYDGGLDVHASYDIQASDNQLTNNFSKENWQQQLATSGQVAQRIGERLAEKAGVHVLYYGHAHPEGMPLAQVRRQHTHFFRSGAVPTSKDHVAVDSTSTIDNDNIATIGAPTHGFGENCNIRLSSSCTLAMAKSLTKFVRERDGGVLGVEALTLPYSNGRWEVACNLLQPTRGSVEALLERALEWDQQQMIMHVPPPPPPLARTGTTNGSESDSESIIPNLWLSSHSVPSWIECAYRVGTTEEQCWNVLELVQTSDAELEHHDQNVLKRTESYLNLA